MDRKSNGITWVSNIYEKLEAMCQDANVQEKAKYIERQVQKGCDSVRKFCAEFMQDLRLPDPCDVEELDSDLSLVYDVDVGMCRKSKVESPMEETLAPAELIEFVSTGRASFTAALRDVLYNVNQGEVCGALTKKSIPISEEVTACSYLEKAGEIHNNHSDACVAVSSAHPYASVLATGVIAMADTHKPHKPISLPSVVSLQNGDERHNNLAVLDFVQPSSEIGRLNDIEWAEASMSTNVIEPSIETDEEFEGVKLEENCLDPEAQKHEACCTSLQERKKRSYKKKLGDVFTSRLRSAKKQDHGQLETLSRNGNAETKHHEENSMSFAHTEDLTLRKLSTHDICESEWVLL